MAEPSLEMLRGYAGGLRWAYYENNRAALRKEIEDAEYHERAAERAAERRAETEAVPQGDDNVRAALAVEVKIEEAWLAEHPEWAHTELGRRFLLLLNHAKAVLE